MLLIPHRIPWLRRSAPPGPPVCPRRRRRPAAPVRPLIELLEDRSLPSVDILAGFNGLAVDPTAFVNPPDTILAAGPSKVVEATNRDLAIYDKAGNQQAKQPLKSFFAPVLPNNLPVPGDNLTDPKVAYDELAGSDILHGRFIVTDLELNFAIQETHLLMAVSASSDPTGAWEMHRIDVSEPGNLADFPQLGWDADGIYVTLNMFKWVGNNAFDHARVLTFATTSLTDGNDSTLTMYSADRLPPDFALQPAAMHGAKPGEPMYFVESQVPGGSSGGGGFLDVVKMTDKLSATPTFTDFKVLVPSYNHPRNADQPGGAQLDTGDGRILSAAWRDGRLVATQTAQADQQAQARWYEFSTLEAQPSLTQTGAMDRGPGVATFMPAINIAPNGDLGLTFLESSASEFLSMYITGQKAGAAPGTLQAPVLGKAGESILRSFRAGGEVVGPRTGDYSGAAIDPSDGSFWAANEYATAALPPPPPGARQDNWGTWVTHFTLSTASTAQASLAGGATASTPATTGSLAQLTTLLTVTGSSPPFATTVPPILPGGPQAGTVPSLALSTSVVAATPSTVTPQATSASPTSATDLIFAAGANDPFADAFPDQQTGR